MSDFIISLGIPTYNGAARIRAALESVTSQLTPDIAHLVEVVVSDNASVDDTYSVISEFKSSIPRSLVYYRNHKNIGYDKNVDMVFKLAKGRYVWLLADDDALEFGAIKKVLAVLNCCKDLSLLQLNFRSFDLDFNLVIDEVLILNDVLSDKAEIFLRNSKERYGQVSSLIFNREKWLNANVEKAYGTNYIHVYALLKILLTGRSYIFNEPLVKVRMGSKNFGIKGDEIVLTPLGVGKIIREMTALGYEAQISRELFLKNRRYVFGTIPYAKSNGINQPIKLIRSLASVYGGIEFWIIWVPVILLPSSLFNVIYKFLKKILRNQSAVKR